MARRARPPPPLSSKLIERINAAFDKIANPSTTSEPDVERPPKRRKRKIINVIPDDEEMVDGRGGFIPEGGDTGGGFLMDIDDSAGGGGGFIPEGEDDAGAGGGFLIDDDDDPLPSTSAFTSAPSPPRTKNRIPLHRIPYALAALKIPSDERDLIRLFGSAASDDEDGVNSISRDNFVKVCGASAWLEGDDDDNDDEEEEEGGDSGDSEEGEDSYVAEKGSTRRSGTTRRSTRSTPAGPLAAPLGHDEDAIVVDDLSLDLSEAESSDDGSSKGVGNSTGKSNSKKKSAEKPVGKGKGKREKKPKWKDRDRALNAQEMRDAQDTVRRLLCFPWRRLGN